VDYETGYEVKGSLITDWNIVGEHLYRDTPEHLRRIIAYPLPTASTQGGESIVDLVESIYELSLKLKHSLKKGNP
jgi:hypothetical protein